MRRSLEDEVTLECRMSTNWDGAIAVVAQRRVQQSIAKAVLIPNPAQLRDEGIGIPDRHGEVFLDDDTRIHVVGWKAVLNGGGNKIDRGQLQRHGVKVIPLSLKGTSSEYRALVLGMGLVHRSR